MAHDVTIRKIAFVGDYLPRKCGIATFTHDIRTAVNERFDEVECLVTPVDDIPGGYDYPEECTFEFPEQDVEAYKRLADFLNFSGVDVVCLQHEFGIYGGTAGSHLLGLLRELRMPVVATLHTVLREPTRAQQKVMDTMAELVDRFVVMSEKGRELLVDCNGVDPAQIDIVPHGIPDRPFTDPNFFKDQFGVEGRNVILTFGLLSPNKGIENMIQAMPAIVEQHPNTVYIILGATHPNLVRDQGEKYRYSLERMCQDLGVAKHVSFFNRFVELDELTEFIGAADIYVTPYLNEAQITSGTLAYSFGCGKAVVSTPYWHAQELLAEDRGVLVPFSDSGALADAVNGLLADPNRRNQMRKRAYMLGREMTWPKVADMYMDSFRKAREQRVITAKKPLQIRTLEEEQLKLPKVALDQLLRLTDSTGIIQHAVYGFPRFDDGYCVDDNARALIFTVLMEHLGKSTDKTLVEAQSRYAAFMHHAFNEENGRFRNFMGFDRQWLEDAGSDDSQARSLWALGVCVGRSKNRDLQTLAAQLFVPALAAIQHAPFPRTCAFGLIAIHEYFRRLSGDRRVSDAREEMTQRLLDAYHEHASEDWPWFEPELTYANAKLSHALLLSGRWSGNAEAYEVGLKSLRWLMDLQMAPEGHFRPVGSNGWYPRGGDKAQFDQQPIEAHATVSACIEAYAATQDDYWLRMARRTFEWFLGRNDLQVEIALPATGGCRDALHIDRVNANQGAESTLAWLISLAEMTLLEQSLSTFADPTADALDDTLLPDDVTAAAAPDSGAKSNGDAAQALASPKVS